MKLQTFLLENEYLKLELLNVGCAIHRLWVKDKNGRFQDVVLGYKEVTDYLNNSVTYFGAVVGRNANRIANSIVEIEGQKYTMDTNEGENNLHSGNQGFHERIWQVEKQDERSITFLLDSPHLDQGLPGNLQMRVTYRLVKNSFTISYDGISDQTTIFNPTNHTYFNLNGHKQEDITHHRLQIQAQSITAIQDTLIPTGELLAVAQTPFDFNQEKEIIQALNQSHEQLDYAGGLDHNFVLDKKANIHLYGDQSGITMTINTNLPGVQVYTGNFISDELGKDEVVYQKYAGICLETQFYPDALHHPLFPSSLIKPNTLTRYWTKFTFTNER